MVTSNKAREMDLSDCYDEFEQFERISSRRDGVMPVSRSKSAIRGQRRSKPPKRTHRSPQHCRSAAHRHRRKWL